MSLKHALLVSLAERDATGYDLTRRFDRSLGFFWSATHQQIYRVLAQMAEAGLVEARTEAGEGRPDRRVYRVTDAGRDELRDWTRRPTPSEKLRSEFAVKVRGMCFGDEDAVVTDIRRQRDDHAQRLAYYEADAAKRYPDPRTLSAQERPLYAVLRGGIRTEQAMLAWCDEMLDLLAPAGTPGEASEGSLPASDGTRSDVAAPTPEVAGDTTGRTAKRAEAPSSRATAWASAASDPIAAGGRSASPELPAHPGRDGESSRRTA